MARPVYSIQILALAPALPNNFVTVPAGSLIVLRDIDATEVSGVSGSRLQVWNAAGGTLWFVQSSASGVDQSHQWTGRQVFNPGESMNFHVIDGTWDIQASGYQLTLP